jgi:hypothetical protein
MTSITGLVTKAPVQIMIGALHFRGSALSPNHPSFSESATVANIIKGNQDGPNSENETYTIPGRGSDIPRPVAGSEVKAGQHPNHAIYELNGQQYVRAKSDGRTNNNVNAPN